MTDNSVTHGFCRHSFKQVTPSLDAKAGRVFEGMAAHCAMCKLEIARLGQVYEESYA